MYQGQKQAGERVQKRQDFIDDAMREYGWMLWNPKAKEIDAMPLDEKGIAAAKDALAAQITELTGGAWARGMSSSVKTETVIKHMEDALEDDAVKSLNSAPYIATYLQKRRDVIEALRAKGSAANLSAKKNQAEVLPAHHAGPAVDPAGRHRSVQQRLEPGVHRRVQGRLRCPQRTRVAPTSVCPTTTGSRSATRDPRSTTRSPGTTGYNKPTYEGVYRSPVYTNSMLNSLLGKGPQQILSWQMAAHDLGYLPTYVPGVITDRTQNALTRLLTRANKNGMTVEQMLHTRKAAFKALGLTDSLSGGGGGGGGGDRARSRSRR